MKKFAKNGGTSLLETLIYAAILIVVVVAVTNSLLAMSKSYAVVKMTRSLNVSAVTAIDRMAREIRTAESVDDSGSVFGSSSGRLKLNTFDLSGAPATIQFLFDNGALSAIEGAGAPQYLTGSSTELISLRFDKIISSTSSQSVKISLTLKGSGGNMERTENFYNTVTLRGSY